MRWAVWVAIGLGGGSLAGSIPTRAYDAPVVVIPGKRGVPVVIDGYDASYCVVEGDWGLARPGHVVPTIVACPWLYPSRAARRSYYPADGRRPGYGRKEIEPPADRRLPRPAPSFNREWQTQSDPPIFRRALVIRPLERLTVEFPYTLTFDRPVTITLNVSGYFSDMKDYGILR